MTGNELKTARLNAGLSQRQLAKRLGVDRRTVQRWESGERAISKPMSKLLSFLVIRAD